MKYMIDMVHHNPGEPPFDTHFNAPEHLRNYGFNGQVFKHVNCLATFEKVAPGVFPQTIDESKWLDQFTEATHQPIRAAKAAGLKVYSHIDLFVLPKAIVEHFRAEICHPQTGHIDLEQAKTKELHRVLIDEIFQRFPELDGLIIRVGETYLHDTPHHIGNGAVDYSTGSYADQQAAFVQLIQLLREEVCERHNKLCFFRTWDTYPDRLHSSLSFYLTVTDAIEPHENLVFSIKHCSVDFHRWVETNRCLAQGKHKQIIEVQCQREYEGKGAYPNYSSYGIINGFPEPRQNNGLHDLLPHPTIQGVYTWSRGGGWYGPYITRKNELWSDLNAYVIARYAQDTEKTEAQLFEEYCQTILRLETDDTARLREIAVRSLDAVVKGKCCTGWDQREDIHDYHYPTNQWMRDDVLHGYDKLEPVFDYLIQHELTTHAIEEKKESVAIWKELVALAEEMECNSELKSVISASCNYGLQLFDYIAAAWELLLTAQIQQVTHQDKYTDLDRLFNRVDQAWVAYQNIPADYPSAATLYRDKGWNWPGKSLPDGLGASIEAVRKRNQHFTS